MLDLTRHASRALTAATRAAARHRHDQVLPVHLLVGLLDLPDFALTYNLAGKGFTQPGVDNAVAALFPAADAADAPAFSAQVLAILHAAPLDRRTALVTLQALVASLLSAADPDVEALLARFALTGATVLDELVREMNAAAQAVQATAGPPVHQDTGGGCPRQAIPVPTPTLDQYGIDLTAAAAAGTLDPVSFRSDEVRALVTVLARRTKNIPVLLGHPGVGKTAIVAALAQDIACGRAPAFLAGSRVVALDLADLVAGTKARGDQQERITQIVTEAAAGNVILFIDEIASAGPILAAMVKSAPRAGRLRLVGATTFEAYAAIEKDPALERRLAKVVVAEPSVPTAIAMLVAARPALERHHGVRFSDDALTAAATLASRYISDRFLPDKAIDVLDEAGAAAALAMVGADGQLAARYHTSAAVRSGSLPTLEAAQVARAESLLTAEILAAGDDLAEIGPAQVAAMVALLSGVPDKTVSADQAQSLRDLPDALAGRLIGQDKAVTAVTCAVRRSALGLSDPARPLSFLFAGPTGVGKTELARVLSEQLFGARVKNAMICLDMSEFSEKESVARLYGSPPGYVGYDAGGQLTEAVRANPYALILLDEVEKAHVSVFDALLAVLEDGRMSDGSGHVVSFANTIIIMTTNLGTARAGRTPPGFGPASASAAAATYTAIREHFRPEFLNRLDEVVIFNTLTRPDLERVVGLLLAPVHELLAAKGVSAWLEPAALDALLAAGYDPTMGARPLRRAITTMLVDPLSEALLAGAVQAGHSVRVSCAQPGAPLALTSSPATGSAQPAATAMVCVPASVRADVR